MREIKFRAWDKWNKKMLNEEDFSCIGDNTIGDEYCEEGGGGIEWRDKKDIILMQYTGLKDKNGKEIYEGDILQRGNETRVYWTVVPHNDNNDFPVGGWTITSTYPQYKHPDVWNLKIIGNIYENPELLKANE